MKPQREMPPIHPAAKLFPMMSAEELRDLADDIKANGLQQPIVMFGAHLLDGRNRWRACELAGVEPKLRDWSGPSPTAYAISLNLKRRHLTAVQKAAVAASAVPLFEAEAGKKKAHGKTAPGRTLGDKASPSVKRDESARSTAQAAKSAGAGIKSTQAMKAVAEKAPEVVELVQSGKVETVADAKRLAELPAKERAEVITLIRGGGNEEDAAFSVAAALQKQREERETPVGKVISAIENVRRCAVAVRSAVARLEAAAEEASVVEMKSPEFSRAGMALLQARAEITAVIKKLQIKKEHDNEQQDHH